MSTTYVAYDSTTGWMGALTADEARAQRQADRHADGCAAQGGYADVAVYRVGLDGYLVGDDGGPVWPPSGRTAGAVRVPADELAMAIQASAAAATLGARGGQVGGRSRSPAKVAASRANGQKGGAPVRTYYLLSGEGETGAWTGPIRTTARGIQARATRERCGGDRWCSAWEVVPETLTMRAHVRALDGGEVREVPAGA